MNISVRKQCAFNNHPKTSLPDKNILESFCQHGLVFLAAVNSIQIYVYTGQVGILFSPCSGEGGGLALRAVVHTLSMAEPKGQKMNILSEKMLRSAFKNF